jgi:hypothetical protein
MRALALASLLVACGSGTGAPCVMQSDCQGSLVCVSTSTTDAGTSTCMRRCDHDAGNGIAQRLCSDGTTCLPIGGSNVCYAGGSHAIHTACTSDLDCEGGTACAPDTMMCTQACTVGTNTPCATNEACMAIGGGVCRPTVVFVDAGPDV